MDLSNEIGDRSIRIDDLANAERIATLYRLVIRTLATAIVFSFIVFYVYWPVTPVEILVPWLIANNGVTLLRYLLVYTYRRAKPHPSQAPLWHARFVAMTAIAGFIWGMMGTVLLPAGRPDYEVIGALCVIGTTSVGIVSLGISRPAFLAMTVPVLLPPSIYLAVNGDGFSMLLGIMVFAFMGIMLVNCSVVERNFLDMLRLRFENARIAADREVALVEAQAAGQAKMRFLANMSHEIRTPLNGILGIAHLLSRSPLDDGQRRRVELLLHSGNQLLAVVNDVLDFSKISEGKLAPNRRPFELRRTLGDAMALFAARAEARSLAITMRVAPDVPAWVDGDADRLTQVLNNLVSNALKFTERGRISLEVGRVSGAPGRLRFEVRDTGIGIAPQDQARLFEPFRQLDDSATRRHGGTGLGLAISRELVVRMGGEIGLESRPGEGSAFWFTLDLPEGREGAASPSEEAGTPRPLAGRVLIAEDNDISLDVARDLLAGLGLDVRCAVNGAEAVQLAAGERFDAIVMDCQMPVLDGFAAAARIRQHERSAGRKRVPIIALTASALQGDRERCLAADMDDYVAKPFVPEDLTGRVQRWLQAPPRDSLPVDPSQRGSPPRAQAGIEGGPP